MNRRLNIVLILLAISAILVGFYFWHKNNSRVSVTVIVTDNGFEPETIQIEKGTEVVFKNSGTQPHWPASDFHPTHGIYPEFDPQKPVSPGQSWVFRFNKKGSWNYHDHLKPDRLGVIKVE